MKFILTCLLFATPISASFADSPFWEDQADEKIIINQPLIDLYRQMQAIRYKSLELLKQESRITVREQAQYYEKAVEYGKMGMQALDEAEKLSYSITHVDAKELMSATIKAASSAIFAGSPWKASMAFVAQMAAELAPHYINLYTEMQTCLHQAEHYFELSEFYLEIAKKG